MAAVQLNISKGREVEFYNRVNLLDPIDAVLTMLVLATGGEGLLALRDYEDLGALLSNNPEVTNTNYSRVELGGGDLSNFSPDNTNNRILLTLPLQTFSAIDPGDIWDIVVIAYDADSTGGVDADIIPISAHELRINGTAIVPAADDIIVDMSSGWIAAV